MTKSNITEYDNTAANNTDVEDVPLGENLMYPSDVNNAFREIMADLADVNDGTVALTSPSATALDVTNNITVGGNITATEATFSGNTSVKLPAGTDAQRPTGVNGMLRYNSDDEQFEGYADGAWGAIAGGGGETSLLEYNYTATAGQTTFSGADDNSATLSYTAANLIVTLNGIVLENGTDYTASNGTSIVLAVAAALDDELNVVAFKSFTTADMVPASTGGTFTGNVSVTGNLGIGTSSPATYGVDNAEDLVIGQGDGNHGITISSFNTSNGTIAFSDTTNATVGRGFVDYDHNVDAMSFGTLASERMRIDSSGNVGIGTSSPEGTLHVENVSNNSFIMDAPANRFNSIGFQTAGADKWWLGRADSDQISGDAFFIGIDNGNLTDAGGLSNKLVITQSGNLGIGTSSPSKQLHQIRTGSASDLPTLSIETGFITQSTNVAASSQNISIISGNAGEGRLFFGDTDDEDVGNIVYSHANNSMSFDTANTERLRIDSSGNLLVGGTTAFGTGTTTINSSGLVYASRAGNKAGHFNRETTDGEVVVFSKDGTTVGSITSRSGVVLSVVFNPLTNGSGLTGATYSVIPADSSGNKNDNIIDLGTSANRFDDIYATNTSIIGTSDANEKQQIASLTDAEINAAKALSKLFKTFKWNSAVESKGAGARIHTGHIAQDVQQAMTDAGLDAGDYAFFISTTWWETQTEVPAVAEETDEEGNVTVEAQEAYTRTDTYETAEEAPAGATERTRLGIRYPELLAFVGAATEQRLADIETRIAALESA